MVEKRNKEARYLCHTLTAALVAIFGSGCQLAGDAAQKKDQDRQLEALQSRVEEVERTNGRLTVRMEELEDQLFLLNDRVESHRIALQRRAYQRREGSGAYAMNSPRAPGPTPESYYQGSQSYGAPAQRPRPERSITRIPLSNPQSGQPPTPPRRAAAAPAHAAQAEGQSSGAAASGGGEQEEVVITEEQFRKFTGEEPPARKAPEHSSGQPRSRAAQPSVTDERLTTTGQDGSSSRDAEPSDADEAIAAAAPVKKPSSTGLRLYKDSLAAYRAGKYREALTGFEAFLAEEPKRDYLDNAYYWIGECHYGLGEYGEAVEYFERVLKEQPDGNKVPDAMLKMSLALDRMGQSARATSTLDQLTRRYPMTNAARLGLKRLEERVR